MNAVERLKRDHAILRSKLNILEVALGMGAETWFVLREICHTLSQQLQDHIRREETLVGKCRAAFSENELRQLAIAHRDEPQHVREINQLFLRECGQTLEQIKPALRVVITGLRRHMEEEEMTLFPVFERFVSGAEREPMAARSPSRLQEWMTVNYIVQEFPSTISIFRDLFVNIPFEGPDCLDEVAWRHGMESHELIRRLEHVIGSQALSRADVGCAGADTRAEPRAAVQSAF